MALKPVSNGEPCANAATGRTKNRVTRAAVGRALLRPSNELDLTDQRDLKPTWHMHLRQHLKAAAFGAKLTSLNHQVQRLFGGQLSVGARLGHIRAIRSVNLLSRPA